MNSKLKLGLVGVCVASVLTFCGGNLFSSSFRDSVGEPMVNCAGDTVMGVIDLFSSYEPPKKNETKNPLLVPRKAEPVIKEEPKVVEPSVDAGVEDSGVSMESILANFNVEVKQKRKDECVSLIDGYIVSEGGQIQVSSDSGKCDEQAARYTFIDMESYKKDLDVETQTSRCWKYFCNRDLYSYADDAFEAYGGIFKVGKR